MHDVLQHEDGTFGYAGRKPAWHALGAVKEDASTMTELATLAGLTYEFQKTPVFFEVEAVDGMYHHQYVGRSVITKDGLTPLAVVSDGFEFHQPMELAETMDRIITAGHGWLPETAVALGKGETTVFCARIGEWAVGGDKVQDYFLMTDTVDGRHALQLCIVPMRVVCRNTLRLGLAQASVKVNLNHVGGHRTATALAVDAIVCSQSRVREALTSLSQIPFTMDQLDAYYERIFPLDQEPLVKKMVELQKTSRAFAVRMVESERLPLTGWVAYNSVSETLEHGGVMPELSTRKSLVLGTGAAAATLERAYAEVINRK